MSGSVLFPFFLCFGQNFRENNVKKINYFLSLFFIILDKLIILIQNIFLLSFSFSFSYLGANVAIITNISKMGMKK